MKKNIPCLILLILMQISCRLDTTSSPPEFTSYKNNPILKPGKPGSWDELFVSAPQVIFYENTFYLFYMGGNEAGRMAVGLATSFDGFNYSKFEGNPILAPDGIGFDAFTLGPGIILKEDTTWVMFYNCQELAGYAPGSSVGRATAKQLTGTWIRGNSPVITSGKEGEWDEKSVWMANVAKYKNGFRMYYGGNNGDAIGYAESRDCIHWERYPGNPVYDGRDDPDTKYSGKTMVTTNPFFLNFDTICFLYYYNEHDIPPGTIGVATARVH